MTQAQLDVTLIPDCWGVHHSHIVLTNSTTVLWYLGHLGSLHKVFQGEDSES